MISRDEALAIARDWANEQTAFDVNLFEFDLGYVVCLVEPVAVATGGPPLPPPSTGYPRLVIDRETGEVSQWSSLPWQTIAERYTQRRAAEGRFPPDVRSGRLGGGFTSYIHPTEGGVVTVAARAFADEFDNPVYPIGNNEDGPSELVADAQGKVFMLHWADDFFVGPDLDSAIVKLIRGGPMAEAHDRDW
ncbi:SUKH-3 domain-containing protein [Verrucosispora sp. WMMA2121]|uniref:SUKH-3 domain-containing protein n=1 Tax=Verrucosispora sp. WMMA2121 TaxID=3015164 RepID=UPI0022B6BBB9|nr:SUKH-3 domain-containing protein [Verrucosispora sp. WMMA2121]MCZ7422063.1 SUKH-3 domain-containing protein [Verrucosispora sp. WMMA2121]